jgi:hypothetical protein
VGVFSIGKFEGFTDKDFNAYEERKWRNNRFNLERMSTNQKLEALGRLLHDRLKMAEGRLEMALTQDHPTIFNNHCVDSGWLYFSRSAEQKKALELLIDKEHSLAANIANISPHLRHVIIGIRIDYTSLEVALRIHRHAWVDGKNLFEKCSDTWQLEKFKALISALPAECDVGLLPNAAINPREFNADLLKQAAQAFDKDTQWLFIGRQIGREVDILKTAALIDTVLQDMEKLIPIFHFIAWSPSNDYVSVKEMVKEQEKKKTMGGNEIKDGTTVIIQNGLFAGKTGVVMDIDSKGKIRVTVGKMVVKLTGKDIKVAES